MGSARERVQHRATEQLWPVLLSLFILWAIVAILLVISLRQHDGRFIYALDDPYIHMAMSKNFAQHGVWGITRYEFSSSSSSLLWTFAIAVAFFLFGLHEMVPFVLCLLCASACLWVLDIFLRREGITPTARFGALLLILFAMPLPAMIFTGQEHLLHTLVTLLFVYYCIHALSVEATGSGAAEKGNSGSRLRGSQPTHWLLLCGLAALLPLTRYEGLFLVFIAAIVWLLRGRWWVAVALSVAAGLPVGLYGLISHAQGWFLLPNSVLLKGKTPHLNSLAGIMGFLGTAPLSLNSNLPLLCLFLLACILYILRWRSGVAIWERRQLLLACFMAATYLHMQFARTSPFFRYEAYLVTLGLWAIATATFSEFSNLTWRTTASNGAASNGVAPGHVRSGRFMPYILALGGCLLLLPLQDRMFRSLVFTPVATTNIYDQQLQMARFLQRYYTGAPVAANDIGLINYLADIRCLDLWGLASREVAQARRAGIYDRDQIDVISKAKGVRLAIVFDEWFANDLLGGIAPGHPGGMPKQWIKVGQWKIPHNVVCGEDTVTFYGVNPREAKLLRANLKQFASHLPAEVQQKGF